MRRLSAVLVIGAVLLWASMAWAQYSALGDDPDYGPWAGIGGLYINGDNGAGDSDSEFLPTVNLAGLTDYLAWQAFYGFGTDSTAFGGSVDYILANNFDECFTCPEGGMWWFGAGVSMLDVTDLYFDDNDATAAVSDTYFGPNLGFGYSWEDWSFNLYAHMFDDQFAVNGAVMYNFGK